jgi:ribonucleoside-diphosphate reductase alpha chain
VALQYGVPLRDLVNKFAHVRFEPSGFTGNSEIPIAKSIVDYIFRWLGSRFLSDDDKSSLGLIDRSSYGDVPSSSPSSGAISFGAAPAPVATQPAPVPVMEQSKPAADEPKATALAIEPAPKAERVELGYLATVGAGSNGHANGHSNGHAANGNGKATNGGGITLNLGGTKVAFATQADAPSCMDCGSIMVRNGSCYKCLNCGSTSGCS